MSEVLSPQQIVQEAKSAYKAGDYLRAAQSFEAARQAYISAEDVLMAAEMANNVSVARLQAGDAEGAFSVLEGTEQIFSEGTRRN